MRRRQRISTITDLNISDLNSEKDSKEPTYIQLEKRCSGREKPCFFANHLPILGNWKEAENKEDRYPQLCRSWACSARRAVHPQKVTPCVNLHIVLDWRGPEFNLCEVQSVLSKGNRSSKRERIQNKSSANRKSNFALNTHGRKNPNLIPISL